MTEQLLRTSINIRLSGCSSLTDDSVVIIIIALSFREVLSSKAEKVKELAEDVSLELTDKQFKDIFSSSVQDQAAKKVAKELDVATDTCDMHQGDKIGASAVGELTRSRDGVVINAFPESLEIIQLLRDMVKHFESNPTNRKNYDSVLQDHLYLPRNAFKRDLNGTRISSVYNLIRSCLMFQCNCKMYRRPLYSFHQFLKNFEFFFY